MVESLVLGTWRSMVLVDLRVRVVDRRVMSSFLEVDGCMSMDAFMAE